VTPHRLSTWFEFAPADSADFEKLVQRLRAKGMDIRRTGRSIDAFLNWHILTRAIAQDALAGEGAGMVP
jgi:hypothetical protein